MDFTPVIAQVWGTLGWLIPLMLLIGLLKSPWAKGHIGELLVRLFAHWQLDKQLYQPYSPKARTQYSGQCRYSATHLEQEKDGHLTYRADYHQHPYKSVASIIFRARENQIEQPRVAMQPERRSTTQTCNATSPRKQ